jgi:hypothetical protein
MRAARLCLLGLAALLALASLAPAAGAAEGDLELAVLDRAGNRDDRAGIHPDRLVMTVLPEETETEENPRDLVIDFSPGLGGNPAGAALCPRREMSELGGECPSDSQVGVLVTVGEEKETTTPIYNIEPAPNELAVFGAPGFISVKLVARLRPDDAGLSMRLSDIALPLEGPVLETRFEFWGIPADHQEGTVAPRAALLTMPTRCDEPFSVTVRSRTWERPDRWTVSKADTGRTLHSCAELPFAPGFGLGLGDASADAPTGVDLNVTAPQRQDPDLTAESQIRRVDIALPAGMALSPGGAAGLSSCGDAQFGLGNEEAVECPAASRLGTVELRAAQLRSPMPGTIYLGEPTASERFRLLIVGRGSGTQLKLAGALRTDSRTGQMTAVLDRLPQLPLGAMTMRLDGGPGALLASPLRCGPATATATFVPYSDTDAVRSSSSVAVAARGAAPCLGPPPFAPKLEAGVTEVGAGKAADFSMTLRREDGEQLPGRFSVTLPAGLSASLGQVEACGAAAAAGGACPGASRVGSATAAVGSGSQLASLPGDVFLTGPYRGAPFGLAIKFVARVGAFDLGTVVVRAALRVDALTGRVTIDSDALPTMLDGIQVRFRTIGIDLDRPGFLRNPTSCGPAQVEATIHSSEGARVESITPFQLRGCVALPFRPRLSTALTPAKELRRGGRPTLRVTVRSARREANLRRLDLDLPRWLRLDSSGVAELCSRGAAQRGNCSARARVGSARAWTPLFAKPLRGSVFVAQPQSGEQPDLWVGLRGPGGVRLNLRGESAEVDGRVQTRLLGLPDTPLSRLVLELGGGKSGLFALGRGICRDDARLRAGFLVEGQNGARARGRTSLGGKPRCGGEASGEGAAKAEGKRRD